MLRIDLKSSRYLLAALAGAHIAAALMLVPLEMPEWVKLALAAAIGASFLRGVWGAALLRSRGSILSVEVRDAMRTAVQTRDRQWHEARILGTTFVTPLLTVVNLRVEGRRLVQHVVIVPDRIDPESYRRLRVLLRWGRGDER